MRRPLLAGRKREKRATHARATDVRLLQYYNFYPSFRKRIRERTKCVWKIACRRAFRCVIWCIFFSDLDPLSLAVCDDDLFVLLCVAVCVTDSSACDSSVCACFRGFSFFGFFLLLGRILYFFLRLIVEKRWVAV